MIELLPPHRAAREDDALPMAELVNMAGEGLPYYLWSGMASAGQSAWDVGQERARRQSGGFSYRNTILREEAGRVVASLVGYALDDDPEPTDYADLPPMFVPLQQLEDRAPGTWYVNVGYREQSRRSMVKAQWQHPGTHWVLLLKDLVAFPG